MGPAAHFLNRQTRTATARNPVFHAGGRIVADTCSVVFLRKLGLLQTYAAVKSLILPATIWQELMAGCDSDENMDYMNLFHDGLLYVFTDTPAASPRTGGSAPGHLKPADATLVRAHAACRAQAVLSDDGAVCRYCRRSGIAHLNVPVAVISLAYQGILRWADVDGLLAQVYRLGRYSRTVRRIAGEIAVTLQNV